MIEKLRKICLAFPDTSETDTWGHPNFRVGSRIFCAFEEWKGEPSLAVKVGKEVQDVFLADPRFYKTPYVGQHGWVSLRMTGRIDWEEVAGLVEGSYRLIAPKAAGKSASPAAGRRKRPKTTRARR